MRFLRDFVAHTKFFFLKRSAASQGGAQKIINHFFRVVPLFFPQDRELRTTPKQFLPMGKFSKQKTTHRQRSLQFYDLGG